MRVWLSLNFNQNHQRTRISEHEVASAWGRNTTAAQDAHCIAVPHGKGNHKTHIIQDLYNTKQ